ncbi:MAG TPA: right-handed parallel beta-helix repeat-containing protein [Armatimonadota bacterium]|nr:right-handed parallel beta-helix repeat-containing protein [Armatimonadota bacterium]
MRSILPVTAVLGALSAIVAGQGQPELLSPASAGVAGAPAPTAQFDVTRYPGVDPTGARSSYRGIQAALDAAAAAGGGKVYFPAGTYLVHKAVRAKSRVRIQGAGQGRTILQSNVICRDPNTGPVDSVLIVGGGGNSPPSYDNSVSDMTIGYTQKDTARLKAGGVAALRLSQVVRATVERVTLKYGQGGINLNRAQDALIQNCSVYQSAQDGISCDNGSGSDPAGEVQLRGVRILSNYFENTEDDAISVLGRATGGRSFAEDVTIAGNTVKGTRRHGGGVGVYGVRNCEIRDNKIHNTVSHGIAVHSYTSSSSYSNQDVRVSGNSITSDLPPDKVKGNTESRLGIIVGERGAITPTGKEEQAASRRLVIENNTIRVTDRTGIFTASRAARARFPAADCILRGNTITFVGGEDCPVDYRGIHLQDISNWRIEDNTVSGFPSVGLLIRVHRKTEVRNNRILECCLNPRYAGRPLVIIGDSSNREDALAEFTGNQVRKSRGAVAALIQITDTGGVDGIPGNYEFRNNRAEGAAKQPAGKVRLVTPSVRR